MTLLPSASDLNAWVSALGYVGISAMVFAETGLFFCFFFPGDSLLFTAGLLASTHVFRIDVLVTLIIVMAFLGYSFGYWFGMRLGSWLEKRPDTWYYKRKYLENTRRFYDKYGKNALLMGRFVPVIRTFIPIVGGIVRMRLATYTLYNFLGAAIWGALVPLLGYFLGALIPDASRYLLLIVVAIVFLSILPGIIEWVKNR